MSSFSSSGSGGGSSASVAEKTQAQRSAYITDKNGDAVGNNWVVPKADFGKFLGYKAPTAEEQTGKAPVSGQRVMELALQKEMQDLGLGAAKHGNEYRNMYVASGRFDNQPGREKDMVKNGLDAVRQGQEKNAMESTNLRLGQAGMGQYAERMAAIQDQQSKIQQQSHNDNVKLLEMQYKFQEMSKQQGTISNLMKTRHDSISRSIRGGQG
ncbi:MAG TPA: hypothetical protein VFH51_18385 [Myxococcota bacterium]|nr:hypothetical protein [Myxococcota bacterium]